MKNIIVVGEPKFTLGFRLTGIRKTINVTEKVAGVFEEILSDANAGIVIVDEVTMAKLDERVRQDVVSSIDPVFVTVSETAAQEELRKMILQSIGVDLLKEE